MTDPITPPEETPNVSPGDTTDGGGSGSNSDNVDGDNGTSPVDPVQPVATEDGSEVAADTDAVTPEGDTTTASESDSTTPTEPEFNVGDAVTIKRHNGNDTGKTGVIESVDGDTRMVHLSDGRHIAFNVGQLM